VSWLADPADAEDLVQETFLRLHRESRKPGARIDKVGAFLFKAAHNLALDSLRRRRARDDAKRRATHEARASQEKNTEPLQGMVRRAAAQKAMDELAQLPGDERRIVFLKIVQGFSLREIADIMGLAFSSVAYKLSSGLGIMARRLEDAGVV
jgi:RNA polymerase sigma-70 factor (ECF subfamily)